MEVPYEQWEKKGIELFGTDKKNWKFKCASCGHIQSINSVFEHNPSLNKKEIGRWIYIQCEGRTNKGHGCDWALYGFIKIHTREIIEEDGSRTLCFEFEGENES